MTGSTPATMPMPRQPLSHATAAALEIIAVHGAREMRRNDFELYMHQRGYQTRQAQDALKAFERRGWLESCDSMLRITVDAYAVAVGGEARTAPASAKPRRTNRPLSAYLAR
jgi:hypothetical protein